MFSSKGIYLCTSIVGSCILTGIVTANAQLTFPTTRTALAASDTADWTQYPGNWASDPNHDIGSSTLTMTTPGGVTLTASQPSGNNFQIWTQGPDFPATFKSGEPILWTSANSSGPITISFASPVAAAGAEVEIGSAPSTAFTGTLNVYDASNTLLGTFTKNVTDTASGLTPLFLGVRSTSENISSIVFSLSNPSGDIAMNELSVSKLSAVPEPSTYALAFGLALLGFAGCRKGCRLISLRRSLPAE